MSRPRDLSSASSAPRCTSAADKVAVAVVVANGGTSWVYPRGCFPAQSAPRAGGTGFTHQIRAQLLKCPSGRRCAERQLYDFSSHSGAAQKRPLRCGPPRLRQDGCDVGRQTFPPKLAKVFFIGAGITTGGQFHSRIQPGSLTHDSPTPLLEKRINPESCGPFSSPASHACGGAVTRAVDCAMSGSQLVCMEMSLWGWKNLWRPS